MDRVDGLLQFSGAFNRNSYYIGIAYMLFLALWVLSGLAGAAWAAYDAPKRGARRLLWIPGILLGGPFMLAAYAGNVRRSWPAAAALWCALFLLPAAWVGALVRERRALYGYMRQNLTPPVPLMMQPQPAQPPVALSTATSDAELIEAARAELKNADALLEDAKKTEKKYKGK